jgi:hydroxymethylbilane synthase
MTIRLATRTSPLALAQANFVKTRLAEEGLDASLVLIESEGDRNTQAPLKSLGGQGIFAVAIQEALLDGRADIAVHSAKDLPSLTPEGLLFAGVPERRTQNDMLIGAAFDELPNGARIATGSPRRRALLLEQRPDLDVVELRGNMAKRFSAVGRDGIVAVVAAAAAIERLGESTLNAHVIDPSWCVPQVGQGAIGLETRCDDLATQHAVSLINDIEAFRCVTSERAFLRELGAGCSIPVAANAQLRNDEVELRGVMVASDGTRSVRGLRTNIDGEVAGIELAKYLRDDLGGGELPGWAI